MIHDYKINGLSVKTGDLICTSDGGKVLGIGEFWRLIGKLIPGEVDHIVIYVGPAGRCVEAGARGVIQFEMINNLWNADEMVIERLLVDTFYGIAFPLKIRDFSLSEENRIRRSVADYCLSQARANKPYNLNLLDSQTDNSFYCSQLAYKAYLRQGIDLNSGQDVPNLPCTKSIIFPQEIWSICPHIREKTSYFKMP